MNIKILLGAVMVNLLGFGFFAAADAYVTREQFFTMYIATATQAMPASTGYQDVILNYRGVRKNTPAYAIMQKAVYYEFFPNAYITVPLRKNLTEDQACSIIKRKFPIDAGCAKSQHVTYERLREVLSQISSLQKEHAMTEQNPSLQIQLTDDGYLDDSSLNQIYDTLSNVSETKNTKDKDTVYTAIENVVNKVQDPYTVFFPPTQAQQFNEGLKGEFEGIGAYVDMATPGILIITSPIPGSPAEEADLRPGDRILKIDTHRVTPKTDMNTAVSRIKGPVGTQVRLLILRNKKTMYFTITRNTIVVHNVSAKTYHATTCYMSIGMFGYGVYNEFAQVFATVFGKEKCQKYVFDIRNNPGGSLEEVAEILSYFVPAGQPTVVIDSKFGEESILASDVDQRKLSDKKIIILMNQWSASASEIFAGTIKDYLPTTTLIGDTTYGKGSVQELLQYPDGSMLKYTIAKWYTGKTKTTIDHNGLQPDIKISDDPKTAEDEPLEHALQN